MNKVNQLRQDEIRDLTGDFITHKISQMQYERRLCELGFEADEVQDFVDAATITDRDIADWGYDTDPDDLTKLAIACGNHPYEDAYPAYWRT